MYRQPDNFEKYIPYVAGAGIVILFGVVVYYLQSTPKKRLSYIQRGEPIAKHVGELIGAIGTLPLYQHSTGYSNVYQIKTPSGQYINLPMPKIYANQSVTVPGLESAGPFTANINEETILLPP